MQHNTETKIWNATLYLRLSRDDGDKEESNSITGQRELLRDFIRSRPELREYAVRIDDGFTGSNFERPSFKKMLEDVKAGRTNCIIVKDLSRFGRNYLDAGEYIEKIFPFLGVRFIAVNDNYDSLAGKNASDELKDACNAQFAEILTEQTSLKKQKETILQSSADANCVSTRMKQAEEAIENAASTISEWNESAVRQIVERVTVLSADEVLVRIKSGAEIKQTINR